MQNRTGGVIATIVAVLLCGCPGLFALCFGAIAASASFIPGSEIDMFGSKDPQSALVSGVGALCLGLIFVLVPIAVGFFTLRKKPGAGPIDVAYADVPAGPVGPSGPVGPAGPIGPSEPFDAASTDLPSVPPEEAVTKRISEERLPPPN